MDIQRDTESQGTLFAVPNGVMQVCQPGTLSARSLKVEGEQAGEDGALVDGGGVGIVPAVGGPDGAVERGVGVVQPMRTGVVEVG
jgi:hypothetical protein